jgi:hypothetical protein
MNAGLVACDSQRRDAIANGGWGMGREVGVERVYVCRGVSGSGGVLWEQKVSKGRGKWSWGRV